jgi:two-component sensor histidine kinase
LHFRPWRRIFCPNGRSKIKSQSSISTRLFVLVLVAVLPLTTILFFNLYSIRLAQEREVHAEAFRTGQLAAVEMERLLGGIENTLLAIAAAPVVQGLDPAACNRYMVRIGRRLPEFAGIAVLDSSGVIRCWQQAKGVGVSLADRDYVKESLNGRLAVGEYTVGRVSSRRVLPVSVPITDDTGKVTGVVAGSLNLDWLDGKLQERTFAAESNLTIADRKGVILAHRRDSERFVGTAIPTEFQHLVRSQRAGTIELGSQDGARRILTYSPPAANKLGLYISAEVSTAAEYAAVTRAMYYGVAGAVAATAVALASASLTGRYSIRRPVAHLLRTVEAWRGKNESARTGMSAEKGEFGQLGAAIDAYMDELVLARQQRLKDEEQRNVLMSELDHRVKNLLTTVQAVARQSFKSSGVEPSTLAAFSQRLAAMGEAHALLMKDEWQSAPLRDVVEMAVRPFDIAARPRFSTSGPELVMNSKAALALGMALHELCTNATKYGALTSDDGVVRIVWRVESDGSDGKPLLVFEWIELGGSPVVLPAKSGFGSTMIERMLGSQIEGTVDVRYDPDGLKLRLRVPVVNVKFVS